MFVEPPRTAYDLNFNIGPIPVRVHPMFWLVGLILGGNSGGLGPFIWVVVLFISILVHELGHVLAFRRFGVPAKALLYGMGGLAIPDANGGWEKRRITPVEDIIISFCGPLAGFILAWLVVILAKLMGLTLVYAPLFKFIPYWHVSGGSSLMLLQFIHGMIYVNIFWGLVNLLPIYPLDGGRISQQLLGMARPVDGGKFAVILSIVVAGLVAAWGLQTKSIFIALMFGYLAYINIKRHQHY